MCVSTLCPSPCAPQCTALPPVGTCRYRATVALHNSPALAWRAPPDSTALPTLWEACTLCGLQAGMPARTGVEPGSQFFQPRSPCQGDSAWSLPAAQRPWHCPLLRTVCPCTRWCLAPLGRQGGERSPGSRQHGGSPPTSSGTVLGRRSRPEAGSGQPLFPIGGHSCVGLACRAMPEPRQVLMGSVWELGSNPAAPAPGGSRGGSQPHTLSCSPGTPLHRKPPVPKSPCERRTPPTLSLSFTLKGRGGIHTSPGLGRGGGRCLWCHPLRAGFCSPRHPTGVA